VDVVSQGEYIEADAPIEVVRVDGNRIVVRQALGGPGKE
jgi:membrane-bound ClpP family serine protease